MARTPLAMRLNVRAALGAWCLITSSLLAAEPVDVSADLEALVKKFKVPALAVAVLEGDRLTKLGATGIRARGHEEKVTPGDLWHLGSCTKAMTATLCARLVEKGSLRWDL
ncbi:MAG: serine hydrolase domain-containing protein, partial [Planctomycetota bacterium]